MNKEELEKEAEELIQRVEMGNSMNGFMQLTPDRKQIGEMLVMIAEPREKRIAELEQQLAISEHDREHNDYELTEVYKKIVELEAQIDKMKCCCNCKHSRTEYEHCETNELEKWEIKEK